MKKARVLVPALCLVASLTLADPAWGQQIPIPHHQDRPPGPPLSPREALERMVVPDGFTVELVAAEPDIVNPVAMTFDQRGRIWITESLEYPRRSPGRGRDRIKVLEDTNGDGKADKVNLFADGFNIPSGIAVGYGGVWVANAPDILFLQDTDGDGRADRREVVVTGFGRNDTHELPNSLTWGPDGWLYGLNGVFNHSHVKYPPSSPHARPGHDGFSFTCAMFRIHPRTREFQVFAEGTSNPWGIAWDTEGSAFISACVIDHLWHITETGYYHRQAGAYPPHTWKIPSIVKHHHQKAAYCGIEFFDSDAYPEEYRERLYMGNIHGNCVNVDVLQRAGSTYFATPAPDFLSAHDVWFMPVAQKVGPDGCLYVLDWYDQYHCYQDANRDPEGIDRRSGRLYRIRYRDTPRVAHMDLGAEPDSGLLDRLLSPNIFMRHTAQRLLQERNHPSTRQRLQALVFNERTSRKARLHALWSLIGGGPLEDAFHESLLHHGDAGVRAWGVRAAGNQQTVSSSVREQIAAMVHDASPEVRLQVAIAATKIEGMDTMRLLVESLANAENDPLIPHIVWANLHPRLEHQAERFLELVKEQDLHRSPALSAILPRAVARILAEDGQHGGPAFAIVAMLLDDPRAGSEVTQQCLQTIAQMVQSREITGDDLRSLKSALQPAVQRTLRAKVPSRAHFDAALLAATWKDPVALETVRMVATDSGARGTKRLNALHALIAAQDDSLLSVIGLILAAPEATPTSWRGEVIASLGRVDDPRLADVLLEHHPTLEPELKPRVVELLTQRDAWSKKLLRAIGRGEVPAAALNLNQIRRLLASRDPQLVDLVRAKWGTIRDTRNPEREKKIAEIKQLLRTSPGDPYQGEKVFKKVCAQCHTIYGQGEDVGPDITLNGRNSFDQLLSNVLDPSLVIGAAYRAYTVITADGRVLTGLLVEDSPQRVVLKVQGGKSETIARADVELLKESDVSLMPEELETQLKQREIVDLFAYLVLDRPPNDPRARQLPGVRPTER